ncbi:hypothetical protein F2P79_011936 [Pimephales promelas]|nr:hypothetical protein F2P79_011936 [Pimephales promelas]
MRFRYSACDWSRADDSLLQAVGRKAELTLREENESIFFTANTESHTILTKEKVNHPQNPRLIPRRRQRTITSSYQPENLQHKTGKHHPARKREKEIKCLME